jgi:hypothetical protein
MSGIFMPKTLSRVYTLLFIVTLRTQKNASGQDQIWLNGDNAKKETPALSPGVTTWGHPKNNNNLYVGHFIIK